MTSTHAHKLNHPSAWGGSRDKVLCGSNPECENVQEGAVSRLAICILRRGVVCGTDLECEKVCEGAVSRPGYANLGRRSAKLSKMSCGIDLDGEEVCEGAVSRPGVCNQCKGAGNRFSVFCRQLHHRRQHLRMLHSFIKRLIISIVSKLYQRCWLPSLRNLSTGSSSVTTHAHVAQLPPNPSWYCRLDLIILTTFD